MASRAEQRTDDIGREHAGDPCGVHGLDPHLSLEYPRIVDQRGHRAQFTVHGREEPNDIVFIRHVGADGDRPATRIANARNHAVGRIPFDAIIDTHGVAAGRGEPCRGGADTAAGARDEYDAWALGCAGHEPTANVRNVASITLTARQYSSRDTCSCGV